MKRRKFHILFFIPMLTACLESPVMTTGIVNGKEEPTVVTSSTNPVSDDGSLFFQGEIMSKGKSEIIEKGFYWSSVSEENIKDNIVVASNAAGDVFTYQLKGASGEKIYYWQAYAKNSYGCDYGEVCSCRTPNIWEAKDSLPAIARGKGAIFLVDNKIYITCGELESMNYIPVNNTWEYSIATDKWNEVLSFPGDYRIYPVAFTIGSRTFVGTGLDSAVYNDFYVFNSAVSARTWTNIATPADFEARREAVAFSLNGNGYVIGGRTEELGSKFIDVWRFNADNNLWNRINDFPVPFFGGISISNGTRVFAGFGKNDESSRTLWEYNDKDDKWSEFVVLPQDAKEISSGVIISNTIYIVDSYNQVWTLDLSDKTWNHKTDLPSDFLNEHGEGGYQILLTDGNGNSNSMYVGLGYSKLLYEYRPLWDN